MHYDWALYKKRKKRHRDTGARPCNDGVRNWSQRTSQGTPRIASGHRKLEEKHGTDFLSDLLEGNILLTSWSQIFSLQNCVNNFFRPVLWFFVAVVPGVYGLVWTGQFDCSSYHFYSAVQETNLLVCSFVSQNKSCNKQISLCIAVVPWHLACFPWLCGLSTSTCQSQGPHPYSYSKCDFQNSGGWKWKGGDQEGWILWINYVN